VGAGIGGPALALWLERAGMDVVLLEARPADRGGEGAFLGVAPNGMRALAALGLADRILARGHACSGFAFLNHAGRTLGTIDRSGDRARFGWPLTMIRRADLHALLAEACAARGIATRHGERLASLDPRGDRVVAQLDGGGAIEADVVVGCDGLRSATRALALPEAPAPTWTGLDDHGGFVAGIDLPFEPGVNVMVFGKRAFFGAFRAASGEIWWFHNGPRAPAGIEPRAHLLALHAEDPSWVSAILRRTELLGPWPIHELVAMPRWSAGRVCLIGDAAHAMSPSAGQGASLAFEDAQALAQCLRDLPDPAHAFARFEAMRRPRVDRIAAAARRNTGNKVLSPVGAWIRDRLLPIGLRFAGEAQARSFDYALDWAAPVG